MEVDQPATTVARGIDDAQMNRFLKKIVFFSSGGSFLDGYVLSLIGVALVQLDLGVVVEPGGGRCHRCGGAGRHLLRLAGRGTPHRRPRPAHDVHPRRHRHRPGLARGLLRQRRLAADRPAVPARLLHRRRLPDRHLADRRVQPAQGAGPQHGHRLRRLVPRRDRCRVRRLRPVHHRRRLALDAGQRADPVRRPAHRSPRHSRVAPLAGPTRTGRRGARGDAQGLRWRRRARRTRNRPGRASRPSSARATPAGCCSSGC